LKVNFTKIVTGFMDMCLCHATLLLCRLGLIFTLEYEDVVGNIHLLKVHKVSP